MDVERVLVIHFEHNRQKGERVCSRQGGFFLYTELLCWGFHIIFLTAGV